MARITEKGTTTVPDSPEINPRLNKWLHTLQLQVPKVSTYSESIDVADITATTYSTQTFTVTGLDINDAITVNPPALTSGLYLVSYRVSAANTLSLTFYNSTGGAINEGVGTYTIMACRI